MRFVCINDGVPDETVELLAVACSRRGVEYNEVDAPRFNYAASGQLAGGDLLYRPAVSRAAILVEQFLYADGVATFHAGSSVLMSDTTASLRVFEHHGLPVPRWLPCTTTDRDRLRGFVNWLGGFPLVVKVAGGEGGVGVMRVDTWAGLVSLIDHLLSSGWQPNLMAYVPEAEHWRVIVVGHEVIAAYRNIVDDGDFRSHASDDPADYFAAVDEPLRRIALGAGRALGLEYVGVDVLRHESGRTYLLEANFPSYFAHAQKIGGVDIAGAMVEHLAAKAASARRRMIDA